MPGQDLGRACRSWEGRWSLFQKRWDPLELDVCFKILTLAVVHDGREFEQGDGGHQQAAAAVAETEHVSCLDEESRNRNGEKWAQAGNIEEVKLTKLGCRSDLRRGGRGRIGNKNNG